MEIPEKLFKDFHFQLLQNKKNEQVPDSVGTLHQLITVSNVHCSEQNMSNLGLEQYKRELFTEYFKLVDSKHLLPISVDCKNKVSSPIQSNFNNKECITKFVSYLKTFGVGNLINSGESKLNSDQSGSGNSSNFFNLKRDKNAISLLSSVSNAESLSIRPSNDKMTLVKQIKSSRAFNFKKSHFVSKTDSFKPSCLPMKNRHEDQSENCNKKICVVSESEHKSSKIGFISANKMYRNPLKNNSSDKEDIKQDKESETKNEAFKNFDKKIVDIVLNEIMDFCPNIRWSDIAGLEFVKTTVQEIVIWPLLRPDIFTGLRAPPRGILLFGPPGTGKTLIGKCIATQSNSTFFCISASSLASKWVGESEQMVRVLFAAARLNQPAVIFIDEIDSLLSQRSDKDQDFSRKLKTEFLVQFDGAKTNSEERVLVVGATNRPHELDEAARRRFVKRLFVPLPNESARKQIIEKLLNNHQHDLSSEDLQEICNKTKGYSGSDMAHLCKEAAMGPIRSIGPDKIETVSLDQVRPISLIDFRDALKQVRASVVADDLNYFIEWNKKFGSFGIPA